MKLPRIKKVALAISGGVDSAVAALLLKTKGFDIHAVFMKNWDLTDETGKCSSLEDLEDAKWVSKYLEIPFTEVNFVKEYWHSVFSNLVNEYENGYTPNPDILCNKNIKFDVFYKYARDVLNADAIATGHYARTSYGDYLEKEEKYKGVHLLQAVDTLKDQTFFLSQVNQKALQRTMFPLGNLTKFQVKEIAVLAGLKRITKKKESTGICFIGLRNFQNFISEYVPNRTGQFVDIDNGSIIGEHKGIHQWTLGQRCNIGGLRTAYYVVNKESKTNTIYVANNINHPSLFSNSFQASNLHWIHDPPKELDNQGYMECQFRFQHTKPLIKCKIFFLSRDKVICHLTHFQRALTPGQYAVFYKGQICIGSAKILCIGLSLQTLRYLSENGAS